MCYKGRAALKKRSVYFRQSCMTSLGWWAAVVEETWPIAQSPLCAHRLCTTSLLQPLNTRKRQHKQTRLVTVTTVEKSISLCSAGSKNFAKLTWTRDFYKASLSVYPKELPICNDKLVLNNLLLCKQRPEKESVVLSL